MTDNEIIKALECCACVDNACDDCPITSTLKDDCKCGEYLAKNALNLINRQKAEIEELEAEIDKQYEQARADILGNMADGGTSCHWCIDEHKAEAIKEFAERLDGLLSLDVRISYEDYVDIAEDIDNLVKEFKEGSKR